MSSTKEINMNELKSTFLIVNGTSETVEKLEGNFEYKEREETIYKQPFRYKEKLKDKGFIDVRVDKEILNKELKNYTEISISLSCKIGADNYGLKTFSFPSNKDSKPQLVFHKKGHPSSVEQAIKIGAGGTIATIGAISGIIAVTHTAAGTIAGLVIVGGSVVGGILVWTGVGLVAGAAVGGGYLLWKTVFGKETKELEARLLGRLIKSH